MPRKGDSPQKRQDALIALGIARGAGANASALPRVITPNAPQTFAAALAPAAGTGSLVAAVDITPRKSGLLLCSALFNIQSDAADQCLIELLYVDLLTAITGGTLLAPGLTATPTSTTPVDTSNPPVAVQAQSTQVFTGPLNDAAIIFPSVPVQAIAGHRSLIAFRGVSVNLRTWLVGGTISVIER